MSHILRQNPKTQKSLYQPLDKNSSEVRLLEIEPSVNSKSAIRCRLRKVSLTDEKDPPRHHEKHPVARKIIGTLTCSYSDSVHTSRFPILLCQSCATSTTKHPRPLPPKNYDCIAALPLGLWRASFYSETGFHYHSTTIKLVPLSKLIKDSYPSLKVLQQCREVILGHMVAGTR